MSGIIETSYRIAQLTVRLDRALLTGGDPEVQGSLHDVMAVIFDSVRDEIERGLASGMIKSSDDPLSELLIRGLTRVHPDKAVELRRRLRELLEEFDDDTTPRRAGLGSVRLPVALYPFPESTTTYPEATDD